MPSLPEGVEVSSVDKCQVCGRVKNQHSMLEFCPAPDSPESKVGTYAIVKNTERYPGIGFEFPQSFQVSGLSIHQACILADRLTNYEAGCDYAYYCLVEPEIK